MKLPELPKNDNFEKIKAIILTEKYVNTLAFHGYIRNGGILQLNNNIALNFVINEKGKSALIQVLHQGIGENTLKNSYNRTKTKIVKETKIKEIDSNLNKYVKKIGTKVI